MALYFCAGTTPPEMVRKCLSDSRTVLPEERHREAAFHGSTDGLEGPTQSAFLPPPPPTGPPRMLFHTKAACGQLPVKGQGFVGGAAGAEGDSPLCGWTPSSTRARVTFKKAFRSAGDPPTHLWSLSFAVKPGAGATRGAPVGNGKAGKDKATLSTRWAAPLRNHAKGFPKPLAQPLRFRISGLGLV